MRYTQLRSFYAVAKLGSFAKAADFLHISQPTITAQVKELEEQYNVCLFYRKRNNNTLTNVGKQLFEQVKMLFSLEDKTRKMLIANGNLTMGTLSFGAVSPAAAMPIVEEFHKRYPQIEIQLIPGSSSMIMEGILNGELDAAILATDEKHPDLNSINITEQPIVLAVPKDLPLAKKKTMTLAEITDLPLIHRDRGSSTRKILEKALQKQKITPTITLEVGSREGAREASISGLGISYVGLHEFQPHPDISMVTIKDTSLVSKSYLIYSKEMASLPMVKAVVEIITQMKSDKKSPSLDGLNK